MKKIRILISVILIFTFAFLAGCASRNEESSVPTQVTEVKTTENETVTDSMPVSEHGEVKKRAQEIIDKYSDTVETVFENGNTHAEADELIVECGDSLYKYGDAVLDAVITEIANEYEKPDNYLLADKQEVINSVRSYALYEKERFENTGEQYYTGVITYVFRGGNGGSTEYVRHRFDCAREYLEKMLELAFTVRVDDSALLKALEPIEE